jgi:hypothetical protein
MTTDLDKRVADLERVCEQLIIYMKTQTVVTGRIAEHLMGNGSLSPEVTETISMFSKEVLNE